MTDWPNHTGPFRYRPNHPEANANGMVPAYLADYSTSWVTAVISDTMPAMFHPSNGKMYDSKSRFRDETRARGLTEVGNETMVDRRGFDHVSKRDIAEAIRELGG